MTTGTFSIADLIATRFANAKAFGMETIAEVLRADLAAHNQIVTDMVSDLCDITTDARRLTGGSNDANMTEVDSFGRAPSQKQVAGFEVGFPLKMFQYNTGWTERYLQNATVSDVVQKQLDAQKAHLKQVIRQIKLAIFDDTNYNFVDLNVDNITIGIKRFTNSDGTYNPPDAPDGTAFTTTHTHFSGATPMVVANLTDMITHVVHHGHFNPILAINVAQEAAVRGFVGFTAYVDIRLTATEGDPTKKYTLGRVSVNNRAIGILGEAEVWVKPWVPAIYQVCYDPQDSRKPLGFRQRSGGGMNGLRMAGNFSAHPFGGESMEAEFGVGVNCRTNGAVNVINAGWLDATIA